MSPLPQYTEEKRKGNIGEAFIQYVFSDFCLVHKIDGSYDMGYDIICELIRDKYPTNLLFYIQVKHTKDKPTIRSKTITYWKNSPIPVYVFWVTDKAERTSSFDEYFHDAKYKRFTPELHNSKKHKGEDYKLFTTQDFLRDLIVDHIRCQYVKGFTPIIKPGDFLSLDVKREIGFPHHKFLIGDVILEYSSQILKSAWSNIFSVAILLFKKEGRANFKLALKLINSAKKLCPRKHRKIYSSIYNEMIEYEDRIKDILKEND